MSVRIVPTEYSTLRDALKVCEPGDMIKIVDSYNDYQEVIVDVDNITIMGGDKTIQLRQDIKTKGKNIVIKDLVVVGSYDWVTLSGQNNILDGCRFTRMGLAVTGDGQTVSNSMFYEGMSINGNHHMIKGNQISKFTTFDNTDIREPITHTIIEDNNISSYRFICFTNTQSHHVIFRNNTVIGTRGIIMKGNQNTIENNMISDCSGIGILLSGEQLLVKDNTIRSAKTGIILMQGYNTVQQNTFIDIDDVAIAVMSNNNKIIENIITHCGVCYTTTGEDNVFQNNQINQYGRAVLGKK